MICITLEKCYKFNNLSVCLHLLLLLLYFLLLCVKFYNSLFCLLFLTCWTANLFFRLYSFFGLCFLFVFYIGTYIMVSFVVR